MTEQKPTQPQLMPIEPGAENDGPVTCLGMTFENDAARRDYFIEQLRQKLRDPEFRAIEGFPIGEDEDILALSDPPYYTACPNPFLPDILAEWQRERADLHAELGLDDDAYQREPFASDVSEGKNNPIYNAHSYHTKVPHKAIMRYILHYTDPGDIVFDGFCGTGMTGVAAQLCGDKKEVESLGYRVADDGVIYEGDEPISRLGARKAVLNDLSPAATFIAHNYNTPVDVDEFGREAQRILNEVREECGWMYETWHPHSGDDARICGHINYTVWSDIFLCPECTAELIFWKIAVNHKTGYRKKKSEALECHVCGMKAPLKNLDRAWVVHFDPVLNRTVKIVKRVPVLIHYSIGQQRYEKRPDKSDLELIQKIETIYPDHPFPANRMPIGDESRRNDDLGMTNVHHYYTPRNLYTTALLFSKISSVDNPDIRSKLLYWLQSVGLGQTLLNRYLAASFSQVNRYLKGTLYVSPFTSEVSPWYSLSGKISAISRLQFSTEYNTSVFTCSTTEAQTIMRSESIDYIFTDPPFGANLNYADLNFIWESWHGVINNSKPEAIVSTAHKKALNDYQTLMAECFHNYFQALKPGRWITVEFHNSKNAVWNSIQEALTRVGFIIADVRTLDKQQLTMQQMTSTGAVKQDLVISAYKPGLNFEKRFFSHAGSTEGAWAFVRQHLAQVPVVVNNNDVLETIAERQNHLLFDRMVAYHIQRGVAVPMGAAQFYAGLDQHFEERDGMYFLPEQVAEYDAARLRADAVEQLSLFVNDEKSALTWLRQQLAAERQTFQEIQPRFLQELHQARHEELPDLRVLLEENFLQDEEGQWYVPDPNRAEDLEKLRLRGLLREFESYKAGSKKLRQFRSEAMRAGFAHAWRERDYATIVAVAERLPEQVLQEDPDLLMYYDNASLRV